MYNYCTFLVHLYQCAMWGIVIILQHSQCLLHHNPVLSSFITYHLVCIKSDTTGTTSGAGCKLTPGFSGGHFARSLVFCVVFCRSIFVCPFSSFLQFTTSNYPFSFNFYLTIHSTSWKQMLRCLSSTFYMNFVIFRNSTWLLSQQDELWANAHLWCQSIYVQCV